MRTLEHRFWAKVDKNGPIPVHRPELGPCWLWSAGMNDDGYGRIWVGRHLGAHRVAWLIAHGALPIKQVLHHCDRPACVRIDHLFLGTHLDNMQDKMRKGRHVRSPGEANGRALLTSEEVRRIRGLYDSGKNSQRELAGIFGVSVPAIGRIVRREVWQQVAS